MEVHGEWDLTAKARKRGWVETRFYDCAVDAAPSQVVHTHVVVVVVVVCVLQHRVMVCMVNV